MTRILLSRMIVLVLFAALVVPVVSHAESVMWNFAFPFRLIDPSPSSDSCWSSMNKNSKKAYIKLHNPNVSVAYHIEAKNADTGQVISCGSTVTQGTKIMFRFIPHEYSDLYWFSLGGSFDTPYGHWIAAAGKPVADMCTYLPEQDFVNTKRTTELSDNVTGDFYVSLSIAPPAKGIAVSGALSCEGVATDPARTCTAEQVGVGTATFDWAATTGNFYGRVFIAEGGSCVPTGSCRTSNNAMQRETGDFSQVPYSMPVPAQSLSCPITVVAPSGSPPTTPSLSSGGACVVGEPHTISMTSTDPDGDDIKYGIDWNADGSIDELVPPTGFVPSGTSQQASRTYATTGEKTVRVNATDEGGNTSPWATLTFNCNEGGSDDEDGDGDGTSCPLGYSLQNNTCVFSGCPSGYTQQGSSCVPAAPQCTAGFFCVGNDLHQRNAQCQESFNQSCVFGCSGGGCIAAPSGQGNIIVKPALIRSGETTVVTWQTTDMVSCTVVENNPEISDTDNRENGSFTSSPIRQQTSYTLICTREDDSTFTDSATVNIIPVFEED